LFRIELSMLVDAEHPLVKLGAKIDWARFEELLGATYHATQGAPGVDTRLMVALHYPDSLSVNVGEPALFTVVATGTSLTYQWYKYDEEWNEVALPGKTAATLIFASVTASDEGWYFVVITNPDGQTYASADLYVNDHTP
jgi:Immunoglobulin I-set domain